MSGLWPWRCDPGRGAWLTAAGLGWGEAAPTLSFREGWMQEGLASGPGQWRHRAGGTHSSRISIFRCLGGVWHSSKATSVLFPICSSHTPMRMCLMTLNHRILQGQRVWAGSTLEPELEARSHKLVACDCLDGWS
jgi:hypothetical protein